jgi:hypothetical protein
MSVVLTQMAPLVRPLQENIPTVTNISHHLVPPREPRYRHLRHRLPRRAHPFQATLRGSLDRNPRGGIRHHFPRRVIPLRSQQTYLRPRDRLPQFTTGGTYSAEDTLDACTPV